MDKIEFLTKVNETYKEYRSLLERLSNEQILQRNSCGMWSVKDVTAHIAWYEREMIGLLKDRALVGSNLWNLGLEERNSAIYEVNNERSLEEILEEAGLVHASLLEYLECLSEEDLLKADRFREMPADWIPWEVIASNTFEHYPGHAQDIHRYFFYTVNKNPGRSGSGSNAAA